jgi:hypothetical protein
VESQIAVFSKNSLQSEIISPENPRLLYFNDSIAVGFEHQMHMMNLITRAGWEFRVAAALEDATGKRNEAIDRQTFDAANELADYLLFVDEAPLASKIRGTSGFAEKFAALGPKDSRSPLAAPVRSRATVDAVPVQLHDLLACLDGLPEKAKKAIYARMRYVMSARLSAEDRRAIDEILRETKRDW